MSLEAPSGAIEPAGGKGTVSVTAPPECGWTASSDAAWIAGVTPSTGQGSGQVEFQAASNPAGTTRQGHITVNGQQIPVQQQAAPCRFSVSPVAPTVAAEGGTVTISVTSLAGCAWQASGDAGWVTAANTSGTGAGSVTLRVAPNGGETRSATLLVAGQTVTLTQTSTGAPATAPNCPFSLDRANVAVSAAGGPVTVAVSGTPGCARTATSETAWITVVAGGSGTGSGAVTFNVAANSGAARTGTLTIAGRVLTVSQSAGGSNVSSCSYSITPKHHSIGAAGGAGAAVTVSTVAGCDWSARSNDGWISLASGANGNGTGVVTFNVAANSGSARSGTLTIAGDTVTVSQAAGSCEYSISSSRQEINEKGGSIAVAVSAGTDCGWTATSHESWITITEGAAGSGNGTVRFTVDSTGGKKRSGKLTIAGLTFTVEQDKKND